MIRIRRAGRERAFQILYSCNFHTDSLLNFAQKTYYHFFTSQKSPRIDSFALALIEGVFLHKDKIDHKIISVVKNWNIARIAKIELTILRLAIYEIIYRTDIPIKVSINEGVELSKKYGDINSHKFVNGILDAIAKDL